MKINFCVKSKYICVCVAEETDATYSRPCQYNFRIQSFGFSEKLVVLGILRCPSSAFPYGFPSFSRTFPLFPPFFCVLPIPLAFALAQLSSFELLPLLEISLTLMREGKTVTGGVF